MSFIVSAKEPSIYEKSLKYYKIFELGVLILIPYCIERFCSAGVYFYIDQIGYLSLAGINLYGRYSTASGLEDRLGDIGKNAGSADGKDNIKTGL